MPGSSSSSSQCAPALVCSPSSCEETACPSRGVVQDHILSSYDRRIAEYAGASFQRCAPESRGPRLHVERRALLSAALIFLVPLTLLSNTAAGVALTWCSTQGSAPLTRAASQLRGQTSSGVAWSLGHACGQQVSLESASDMMRACRKRASLLATPHGKVGLPRR